MLRILLFSPKGAGNHYYGPGMNAFRMYSKLDKEEVSLSLAHGYRDQEDLELFDEQFFLSEIENYNLYLGLKFLIKAKKWIRQHARHFDVVHCLTAFHHSFMVSKWFEDQGVPVYIKIGQSDHTGFYHNSLFSKVFGLKKYRLAHANRISGYISISREIREKLEWVGIDPDRIHDIPNGVDTERFKPADRNRKRKLRNRLKLEDKFTVIFTGAFSDRKNPFLIAKGFYRFSGFENSQLLLIGPDTDEGMQRVKIQTFIQKNQIGNIIVQNFVENIEDYYNASDLFVLPSDEEGFSNSMLEAQACGLPVLVTRISGSEDLVDESLNGTFIDRSPESIANALNRYYRERAWRIEQSANARKIIVENYSSEAVLKMYLELFRNRVLQSDS